MAGCGKTKILESGTEKLYKDNACCNENVETFFQDLSDLDCGSIIEKRPTCERCKRPKTVCWCPFLPRERLQIRTNIYILQHPYEESRCLRTVPILENSVNQDKCHVIIGKRFPQESKYPGLTELFESSNTYLLYPGEYAVDIQDLPTDQELNLVLLDGTWPQAKGIFHCNHAIRALKRVQIPMGQKSKYVIRTQPCDQSLSTLETAAIAVATLEKRPEIAEILTAPLVALCNFQLEHGALTHHSREYKIENGLWTKRLSKAMIRKLEERKKQQNES